jgi:hypothetical protein
MEEANQGQDAFFSDYADFQKFIDYNPQQNIVGQIANARKKPHADLIMVKLKNGNVVIGKFISMDYNHHLETGELQLSSGVIKFTDIERIE